MLTETKGYLHFNWAISSEIDYIYGDATGAVKWIDWEVDTFDEILSTQEGGLLHIDRHPKRSFDARKG
jgi:hypothetical protein